MKYTKYRVEFADVDEVLYRVEFKYEEYTGGIIPVLADVDGIYIEYNTNDNKFTPVRGSGLTVDLYNNPSVDRNDFFTVGLFDVEVVVLRQISTGDYVRVWSGYLDTELYSEDYSSSIGTLSVTANDTLAVLSNVDYFDYSYKASDGTIKAPYRIGTATISDILKVCLSDTYIQQYYIASDIYSPQYVEDSITYYATEFLEFKVDLSNFVDEDNESMSKRDVLEDVLEPFGLSLWLSGNICFIYDPSLASDGAVTFGVYTDTLTHIGDTTLDALDYDVKDADGIMHFVENSQTLGLYGGYKKFTINYSPYPDERKLMGINTPVITGDLSADSVTYTESGSNGGYAWAWSTTSFSSYDFVLNNYSDFYEYLYESETTEVANAESKLKNKDVIPKTFVGCIDRFTNGSGGTIPGDQSVELFTLHGGYISEGTSNFKITTEVLADSIQVASSSSGDDVPYLHMFVKIKIGDKYAEEITGVGAFQTVNSWTSTETVVEYRVDCTRLYGAGQFLGHGFVAEVPLYLNNLPSGLLDMIYVWDIRPYSPVAGGYTAPWDDKGIFGIRIKEVEISGVAVSDIDSDKEFVSEADLEFKNDKKLETNIGSKRMLGSLDRGALINRYSAQTDKFSRHSNPDDTPIENQLAVGIMGNYAKRYTSIEGDVACSDDLLRNTSDMTSTSETPIAPNNTFTPVSTLIDSTNMPSFRGVFAGGTLNLVTKTIEGQWQQIFPADFDLTQV